jgi:hypothetical protein
MCRSLPQGAHAILRKPVDGADCIPVWLVSCACPINSLYQLSQHRVDAVRNALLRPDRSPASTPHRRVSLLSTAHTASALMPVWCHAVSCCKGPEFTPASYDRRKSTSQTGFSHWLAEVPGRHRCRQSAVKFRMCTRGGAGAGTSAPARFLSRCKVDSACCSSPKAFRSRLLAWSTNSSGQVRSRGIFRCQRSCTRRVILVLLG